MILKIILLILLMIILSLLLFFLSCIFVPAVKDQTSIKDNVMFSKIEHKFDKLDQKKGLNTLNKTEKEKESSIIESDFEENTENLVSDKKAFVFCSCNKSFAKEKNVKVLSGQSCALIFSQYGSLNYCSFSCIGMGDCKKVCPQKAIDIKNNTAVINELCSGCGKCISACPKGIIRLIPKDLEKTIVCSNPDDTFTSCSSYKSEEKVIRSSKKRFKIWQYCYKLLGSKF